MIKTNYRAWRVHYFDLLIDYYDKFNNYLKNYSEKETDFDTFCYYIYENTSKSSSGNAYYTNIKAPLL